jgi:hypothetical protein
LATDVVVRVIGIPEAVAHFDPARIGRGFHDGMMEAGFLVAREVKVELKPHHYTGRAEQQLHPEPSGEGLKTNVFVGASAALVPELRPLDQGWHSASGKQPPTQAIAEWLAHKPEIAGSSSVFRTSKGFVRRTGTIAQVSAEAGIRSRAFLIARAIGRRGFAFGKTNAFELGWARAAGQVQGIIARAIEKVL